MQNLSQRISPQNSNRRGVLRIGICLQLLAGCSEQVPPEIPANATNAPASNTARSASASDQGKTDVDDNRHTAAGTGKSFDFQPLTLNNLPGSAASGSQGPKSEAAVDPEKQIQTMIARLQPLQILLGQWRGTTRREYENFKAVDNHEWVWDLRTEPERPALTITSDKSPYLASGRLNWSISLQNFTLVTVDGAGAVRHFTGDFSEPVHEIVGSDDKLHRVFRLEFTQDELPPPAGGEQWQLAFAQQENNRYLLEVSKRRRSAPFTRFDTVSTQREGTSFAVSDSGYAEKTCIISEGLGTTELTYKGRSYWVCCSGCKAAFEEDPEKWIARAATRPPKP